jgi:membrane-bound serine protease (ClpP class)
MLRPLNPSSALDGPSPVSACCQARAGRVGLGRLAQLLCLCLWVTLAAHPSAWGAGAHRPASVASAQTSTPDKKGPVVIEIGEQLSAGTLSLVRRGIDRAKGAGGTLVLVLDTPGGQVELMWQIAKAIDRARGEQLNVIALVDKHALSAGALVALTCDSIYMTPGSTMGAAMPVASPGGIGPPVALGEKYLSAFRADFRAWAESHGRSGLLAEAMVDPDVEVALVEEDGRQTMVSGIEWEELAQSGRAVKKVATISAKGNLLTLTADEALRQGMADGQARDLNDLLTSKLFADQSSVIFVKDTSAERLAALLSRLAPLLILLGIVCVYMELQTPGLGLFGVLGLVSFGLLLFGRFLTGLAGIEHFVLIGLGFALLIAELFFFTGTIIAGVTGVVCIVVGLVWSQLGPDMPLSSAFDRRLLLRSFNSTVLWSAAGVLVAAATTRLLPLTPLGRFLVLAPADPRATQGAAVALPVPNASQLVGHLGRTLTPMRPVGKVELESHPGQEFEASAIGPALDPGVRVRVVEHSTGRLLVEGAGPEFGAGGPA